MDTEVKGLLAIAFLMLLLEQSPCIAIGNLLVDTPVATWVWYCELCMSIFKFIGRSIFKFMGCSIAYLLINLSVHNYILWPSECVGSVTLVSCILLLQYYVLTVFSSTQYYHSYDDDNSD